MIGSLFTAALLLQAPGGTWTHLTVADGLPQGEVRALLFGPEGSEWFAVRDVGLAQRRSGQWVTHNEESGLVSNGVAGLALLGGEVLAVGFGGWSVLRDGAWQAHPDVGGRTARVVFSVTPHDGALWFGAVGFAARLEGDGWRHWTTEDGLPHQVVHQVLVDRSGSAWFACRRGLARLVDGEFEVFRPDLNFRSIVEDDSSRIWFGTSDGIWAYHAGEWQQFLPGSTVMPATVDRNGILWAMTEEQGAFSFDGSEWRRYGEAEGLLSNVIFDIAQAPDGAIWFATDRGASRLELPGTAR